MLRVCLLSLSVSVVAVACFAAAPLKIKDVAPGADLVLEADAKIKALEEALSSADKYQEAKAGPLGRDASVLAALAQAIVESEEKPQWKASAADVRDGAIAIGGPRASKRPRRVSTPSRRPPVVPPPGPSPKPSGTSWASSAP